MVHGVLQKRVALCPGGDEDEAFDELRMTQRELLCDRAAHGDPDNAYGSEIERLEQAGVVIGHLAGGVGAGRRARSPDTPVVDGNAAIALLVRGDMRLPGRAVGTKAHEQKQRLAVAMFGVGELDAVGCDSRPGAQRATGIQAEIGGAHVVATPWRSGAAALPCRSSGGTSIQAPFDAERWIVSQMRAT